jgi:hypothetical protein
MKKIYLLIALSFFINVNAQFYSDAPWMKNKTSQKNQEPTFDEIVNSFNEYWKDKDHSKKGSGFKPFKRWENYWENLVKEDGKIISPEEFMSAWQQKKQSKSNKSTLSLPVSNWTPVGPFTHTNTGSWSSGQGRVQEICVDPSNPNTLYVGSPAGGIWKSTDVGITWTPLTDNLPQIGVSGIAVDYSNSNTIYIATGDKDGGDTAFVGIYKSTDGGTNWIATGAMSGVTRAGDLVIHPTNNQILWCATNSGIWKTINGGTSWTNVQAGSFHQGAIRLKPTDPTNVYAVSNTNFYKSTDTGTSFVNIITGLPASSSRLLLDVTPANANYIYILSATGGAFQGIYRSINGGTNWTKTTSTTDVFESNQSGYDLALAVSATNANEIYTGCLNIWKSVDGGTTMTKVNNWSSPTSASYSHADIHFLKYFGNNLYAGTDGGIYKSSNSGVNFTSLTTGLQISQFYKVAVSKQSAGNMVGGLQDNGGHAFSNNGWKNYYGADGMDTGVDPNNGSKYYGFIQFGGSMYISTDGGNSLGSGVGAPAAETGTNDDGGNWVTPMAINSLGEVFAGYSRLYMLNGVAWAQQSSGTIGTGDIELVYIDPSNDNIMYVSNGTRLYKSINKGVAFTLAYTAATSITSICVNSLNNNIVYLTTSGTGGLALKSTNGGTVFASFSTNLPAIGKNVIRHQGRNSLNPLYLGTSLGVYYRDDSMTQWEPFDINLPNVSVTDLEINLEEGKIIAATYGRGIWQASIPIEVPTNDIALTAITPIIDIDCDGLVSPEITVKNNGTNPILSVSITYDYNGTPQNYIWTGSIATGASQIITIPSFTISTRGAYNLNITSTITSDAYSDNNKGITQLYIDNSGTIGVLNTFETVASELLTFNDGVTSSQWKRGINTNGALATPGNNVYTTNFTGNYPDSTKSYLFSQCYNLTNAVNPQIKFKLAFDLEPDYDLVYVQYSTNMGQTWTVLGTQGANWYNSNRTPATSGVDCENCPGAQWLGTNTTLTEYFYPLNSLIGQSNVIFRIVFHSDSGANQLGVVVDNFIIEGTLSNQDFELKNIAIYPNPSTGLFTVSTGNKAINKVEVYDVTGKVVLSKNNFSNANSQTVLDMKNVSNGIYFVKISSEEQSVVKRIIKN